VLWIVVSDRVAESIPIHYLPTMKGTLFVLVTGALLYAVLSHAAASMRAFQRRLVSSEERFRSVVEHAPVGIFSAIEGRFHYLNPAALKILGASSDAQLRDRPVLDRVDAEFRAAEEARLRSVVIDRGTALFAPETWLRLDGSHVNVAVLAAPFQQDGERGALVFFTDISEQARSQDERRLLEEQFRQAQKLESVGRLAGGVAHDFNNLLTVIAGYSQMLQADTATHRDLLEPLREISRAAARASDLTRQLLTFSRRQKAAPKRIAVNHLLGNIEKMLRRLIGEDIRLVLSPGADAGAISMDPGQFEQVIMNLAVNARDAMPQGGTLSIRTALVVAGESASTRQLSIGPGVYVSVMVADTGCGMSPEVKAHIFEPFFTTKEQGKGTGLGLSTVYGIVRQSEGFIWADSAPGQGCTFRMLFPSVQAEDPASQPAGVAPNVLGTETILLAEDEPNVRKFIHQALERHGYTVLDAADGREALACAAACERPIHLLLTDSVMPEMGGAELAGLFQAAHPGIPVLSMSGYADRPRVAFAADVQHIQKPFTAETLLVRIRSLLETSQCA
jgi:PAS domain S-box-containing protein